MNDAKKESANETGEGFSDFTGPLLPANDNPATSKFDDAKVEQIIDKLFSQAATLPERDGKRLVVTTIAIANQFSRAFMAKRALEAERAELRLENSQLREDNKELKQLAERDSLTGVYNRRVFDGALEGAIKAMQSPSGRNLDQYSRKAVCMVDLAGLKAINDQIAPLAGDEAIKTLAQYLQAATRDGEYACRIGGDEFALILSEISANDNFAIGAKSRLEHVLQDARFEYQGKSYPLSVYVSVVNIDGSQDSEAVLEAMGNELNEAKVAAKHDRTQIDLTPLEL